jgi:hypothetical protein
MKIYEIARNLKEAEELRDCGCGYESREAAEKALHSQRIDPFYRNQLKVFEVAAQTEKEKR